MSSKSHTHKRCETLKKKSFSARGNAEIHIQRPFFTIKIAPNGENMLQCLLYLQIFLFLKNTKISIFGGISKFHLWADFGKFGQFWQFWADFAALTVADSMPQLGLNS
jgi:hypothetical protein